MNRICACEHIRLGGQHGVSDFLVMAVIVLIGVAVVMVVIVLMVAMVMMFVMVCWW